MKKWKINALLLVITTCFILLLVETVIRIFDLAPGLTTIPLDNYTQRSVKKGQEFTYYCEINSMGLRELREFDRESKSYRIIFLGDSFVYGLGVSNHETFAYLTEGLLNNFTHKSWTIINVSGPGTGTFYQVNLLKKIMGKIDAKGVVLFYCVDNDPYETMREYNANKGKYSKPDIPDLIKGWMAKKSAIYRFLKLRLEKEGTMRAFPFSIFDQCDPKKILSFGEMDELTRKILFDIKLYLQERGISFFVVLIPRQEQISEEVFEKFKTQYGVSQINYDRFLPQKRLIDNVLKPLEIKFFDLMDELNGKDPIVYYFPIDGHFNKRGNQFVAEFMASKLNEGTE